MMKLPAFLTDPNHIVARLVQAMAAVTLAYCLLGIGFAVCCLPPTTTALCQAASNDAYSSYDHSTLVALGEATRTYTVEGGNYQQLCQMEVDAATALGNSAGATLPRLLANTQSTSVEQQAAQIALLNDGLALSEDSVIHLDQVREVVQTALVTLLVSLIIFIACIGHVACHYGKRRAGQALLLAAVAMLAFFAVALLWALVDFDSLFAGIHSLFFADGTWTFSVRSLLICMYPEPFWMGMGVTWVVTTVVASLISLAIGVALIKKH